MDINTKSLTQSTTRFLHRYHVIIFVIIVFGALGVGIFVTYQNILSADETHGYTAQANNTTFDAATRDNITKLHLSDDRIPSLENPDKLKDLEERSLSVDGRINPFVE